MRSWNALSGRKRAAAGAGWRRAGVWRRTDLAATLVGMGLRGRSARSGFGGALYAFAPACHVRRGGGYDWPDIDAGRPKNSAGGSDPARHVDETGQPTVIAANRWLSGRRSVG